jgi:hypothetical protein
MMKIAIIVHLITLIIGAISGAVPLFIKWNNARKAKNSALTVAEKEKASADKEKAYTELKEYAFELIKEAEKAFVGIDKMLKMQNSSAGGMKKESVFTKLQTYALQKGFEFDAVYWSNMIDEIVSFTKQVNSKI